METRGSTRPHTHVYGSDRVCSDVPGTRRGITPTCRSSPSPLGSPKSSFPSAVVHRPVHTITSTPSRGVLVPVVVSDLEHLSRQGLLGVKGQEVHSSPARVVALQFRVNYEEVPESSLRPSCTLSFPSWVPLTTGRRVTRHRGDERDLGVGPGRRLLMPSVAPCFSQNLHLSGCLCPFASVPEVLSHEGRGGRWSGLVSCLCTSPGPHPVGRLCVPADRRVEGRTHRRHRSTITLLLLPSLEPKVKGNL